MMQRGSDTSFINLWSLLLCIYNHYYIILRMHKKTRKIQFNHITDKAKNNKRIKRNEEKVCVCVCVWMLDDVWLVH